MKNKNIFVTGATGFIGSYIVRYLVEQGYKHIFCLRRTDSDLSLLGEAGESVQWFVSDLRDIIMIDEWMADMDIIIHAAAIVSFDPKDRKLLDEINAKCTANLVNLALVHQIEKFIYISSISSLGRTESNVEIDENASWKDSDHNSAYAVSKYNGELEVWRGMEEGLSASVLNPGIVLGAGRWGESSTKLFKYVFKGGKFVSSGVNSFVDVRDVAFLTEKALHLPNKHDRFIVSSENLSYREIFQSIARNLDKPVPKLEIPDWVGELVWRVLKFWSFISGKKPLITKETFRTSRQSYLYKNDKSKQAFNHHYIPIEQTIKETSKCFMEANARGQNFGRLDF
jgi:nucleoside-diphosphate-sugar epimerase